MVGPDIKLHCKVGIFSAKKSVRSGGENVDLNSLK